MLKGLYINTQLNGHLTRNDTMNYLNYRVNDGRNAVQKVATLKTNIPVVP